MYTGIVGKPLQIVILGGGSAAQRHFLNLKKVCPESDVYVVSKWSKPFHFNWTSNLDDVKRVKFDIGVIATPAPFHLDGVKLLAHSCDLVLVEKPLASSLDDAKRILEISENSGSVFTIGYQLRHSESLGFMHNFINSNRTKIFKVDVSVGQNLSTWRKNHETLNGVSSNKRLGGGVLLELSHEIDYLNWLFGPLKIDYASFASKSKYVKDVEDVANVSFIAQQYSEPFTINLSLDMVSWYHHRFCHIVTPENSILWNGRERTLDLFEKNSKISIYNPEPDYTETMWKNLVSLLVPNSPKKVFEKIPTIADGFETLKIVERIKILHNHE